MNRDDLVVSPGVYPVTGRQAVGGGAVGGVTLHKRSYTSPVFDISCGGDSRVVRGATDVDVPQHEQCRLRAAVIALSAIAFTR